jgi:hypothetical protein
MIVHSWWSICFISLCEFEKSQNISNYFKIVWKRLWKKQKEKENLPFLSFWPEWPISTSPWSSQRGPTFLLLPQPSAHAPRSWPNSARPTNAPLPSPLSLGPSQPRGLPLSLSSLVADHGTPTLSRVWAGHKPMPTLPNPRVLGICCQLHALGASFRRLGTPPWPRSYLMRPGALVLLYEPVNLADGQIFSATGYTHKLPPFQQIELVPSFASLLRGRQALSFLLSCSGSTTNLRQTCTGGSRPPILVARRARSISWLKKRLGEFPLFPSCVPCFWFIESCTKSPNFRTPASSPSPSHGAPRRTPAPVASRPVPPEMKSEPSVRRSRAQIRRYPFGGVFW